MVWGFGKHGRTEEAAEATGTVLPSSREASDDPWAARLEQIDRYLNATHPKGGASGASSPQPEAGALKKKRSRWWWFSRGVLAFVALFVVTVLWPAITAPLSKSLQPIAPPQITLLAADGTPIARNGAIVDKPVQAAKLPPQVTHA